MACSKIVYISSALLVLAYFSQAYPQDSVIPSAESLYKDTVDFWKSVATSIKDKGLVPDEVLKDKVYVALKDAAQKASDKISENLKKFDKDSKSYGTDFQTRFESLNKQFTELSKSVGSKDFIGKSEKFYDSIEQHSKELSLKATELLKTAGLPEHQQTYLKNIIDTTSDISSKLQNTVSQAVQQVNKQ